MRIVTQQVVSDRETAEDMIVENIQRDYPEALGYNFTDHPVGNPIHSHVTVVQILGDGDTVLDIIDVEVYESKYFVDCDTPLEDQDYDG